MEADFSGYATKAGLKCSDGRTILPDAFKHQDTMQVPLVWQHGHRDPENVLGHVVLENRKDGVYAYGFFNDTDKAKHIKQALLHKDINQMSIWANDLIERSKRVMHGVIREVSLVLSGANPGALIENVTIRHSDGDEDVLPDEAIIYTGLTLEHSSNAPVDDKSKDNDEDDEEDETIQHVIDSMNDKQKEVLHFMIGEAIGAKDDDDEDVEVVHANGDDETIEDVYNSMSDKQKQVLHYMIGEALESAGSSDSIKQDNVGDDDKDDMKGESMKHNVFEKTDETEKPVLSHSDMQGIIADATRTGSLKTAVESYAIAHGIEDIDLLFPDAVAVDKVPEFLQRRVEWVGKFLGAVRKSPFSRIKTFSADITLEDARAKGYVKGALKKEEFFGVARRVTTPTTIYKKQSLDRDDVVDITDFDIVAWLKGEMRLMLDEELARAAMMGDGRDVAHEDKINEQNIRPIATDHELFVTTLYVNIDDANSSIQEAIDAIVANRWLYKGTGQPTLFTSETFISRFLLLRDTLGRRIYRSLDEVATELRVQSIVPVEAMEDYDDLVAIIVNPVDYVLGATRGGEVSMFEDFDIDYNKQKYLIETRVSGALTRLKSAIVIRKTAAANVLVAPATPAFDGEEVTITDQTGVVYKNADTDAVINAAGSPYAVANGATMNVVATPAAGYYFATSEDDQWSFTNPA
jgi:hypothetical protein